MKYKVGDRVRIKSIDWYNENKDKYGFVDFSTSVFVPGMSQFCGKIVTIEDVFEEEDDVVYCMEGIDYDWTNEMIEGLVEEETKPNIIEEAKTYWDSIKDAWICPEGYVFKDENGNVINAMKIVLEKKEVTYPKSYEECSLINGAEGRISLGIIGKFTKLINARNAYWKIVGEEMGLGKSWEPDYKNPDIDLYVIINIYNRVEKAKYGYGFPSCVFTFPTEKMRDEFYENFKSEIEICKELL